MKNLIECGTTGASLKKRLAVIAILSCLACGEEYYSTPEKTLERYLQNKTVGSAIEVTATLNCFSKRDQQWWSSHYMALCEAKFGAASRACESGIEAQSTVWTDSFEHAGPESLNVEKSDINEEEGTAVLVVDGVEVYFVKERGNWKLDGFFGVDEAMEKQYPQIAR